MKLYLCLKNKYEQVILKRVLIALALFSYWGHGKLAFWGHDLCPARPVTRKTKYRTMVHAIKNWRYYSS